MSEQEIIDKMDRILSERNKVTSTMKKKELMKAYHKLNKQLIAYRRNKGEKET